MYNHDELQINGSNMENIELVKTKSTVFGAHEQPQFYISITHPTYPSPQ